MDFFPTVCAFTYEWVTLYTNLQKWIKYCRLLLLFPWRIVWIVLGGRIRSAVKMHKRTNKSRRIYRTVESNIHSYEKKCIPFSGDSSLLLKSKLLISMHAYHKMSFLYILFPWALLLFFYILHNVGISY